MPASSHHAPAARYPLAASRGVALALLALSGVALAVVLAWLQQQESTMKPLAGLAAWLLGSAAAWRWWRDGGQGELVWDGGQWLLALAQEPQPVAPPEVCLDLQGALLVRLPPPAARRWLWLERRSDPRRWADMRRALAAGARVPDAATLPQADAAR